MDAVKLRRLLGAGDEGAEVDEGGAGLGHGGDSNLAKEVDAVGRGGDADGDEVAGAEAGELMVAQVVLDLESVDWARVDACDLEAKGKGSYHGGEVLCLVLCPRRSVVRL